MTSPRPTIAVFDIGNVLIEWDPRHLYRKMIADEAAMEHFLATVCTPAWNLEQDRGRSFADGVELLLGHHPDKADLIRAFDERWEEMVPGEIPATVALLADLRTAGTRTFAITNFSHGKFDETVRRFPFLAGFEDVVVSAREKLLKPDPAIYHLLLDRNGLTAQDCVFIDDSAANVEAARAVGMSAVHFTPRTDLRAELSALGLKGA